MLGLVTTDQGPNPEFVAAFQDKLPGLDVQLSGALDDLSVAEIDALAARHAPFARRRRDRLRSLD